MSVVNTREKAQADLKAVEELTAVILPEPGRITSRCSMIWKRISPVRHRNCLSKTAETSP